MTIRPIAALAALLSVTVGASAAAAQRCTDCAVWNAPHVPFRIFGNAYFVGTNGLSAVLVTSDHGHVLIDGALPESVPLIEANIRALGFRVEDVKMILNSHAHFDHAGGIADLQKASGARVVVSPASARELAIGNTTRDDPQFGIGLPYPRVAHVETVADGETIRLGSLALTAHYTAGHTPGGTTWSWESCEQAKCLELVYADSQTPVSADAFLFTRSREYPTALQDFEHGQAALEHMRCDILITPHPSASRLWERLAARDSGNASALIDGEACKRYAQNAREQLSKRVSEERAKR